LLFFTIWPLFALICLGYILVRRGFPNPAFWPAAERINYFLLFPALLVSSLADAPVRDPQVLRLGGAAVAIILFAALALALTRRAYPMPAARLPPWADPRGSNGRRFTLPSPCPWSTSCRSWP